MTTDPPAARVLAALEAAPEGLTTGGLYRATRQTVPGCDVDLSLNDLVASGQVWKVRRLYPDGSGEWRYYSRSDALRRDREPSGAWR